MVGHSPGRAPRPRADSLDSLGEEEGEVLSSSEGGSEEGEMVEGYADAQQCLVDSYMYVLLSELRVDKIIKKLFLQFFFFKDKQQSINTTRKIESQI